MMQQFVRRAALVLALGSVPVALDAQGTPDQRIEAARRRAATVGVPTAMLDSKVAEGRMKGIPADRIADAVEQRLALLTRARGSLAPALGAGLREADLTVGADALAAGVSEAALAEVARSTPPGRRAVAISVLTELVRQGQSSEEALRRVKGSAPDGSGDGKKSSGPEGDRDDGRGKPDEADRGRGRGGGPPSSVGPGRGRGPGGSGGPPSGVGQGRGKSEGQGGGRGKGKGKGGKP